VFDKLHAIPIYSSSQVLRLWLGGDVEELEDRGGNAGEIREFAARLWEESEVLKNFRRLQFDERLISTRYKQVFESCYETVDLGKGLMGKKR